MSSIVLEPSVLKWARTRSGLSPADLALKVIGKGGTSDQVHDWEETGKLTFRWAEILAEKTHTPFGCLFLEKPPIENLPIRDFRTSSSAGVGKPSPNLLDVIYQCQQRQAWYRDHLKSLGAEPLKFVGALNTEYPIRAAEDIRSQFKIGSLISYKAPTWRENLSLHFEAVEAAGVLVMRSGVVSNNPNRKLSTDEFRGFALSDDFAPLVFINSRDTLAAQLFTLVHEITHVCLGESAVSNPIQTYAGTNDVERYCNMVAAEVLVPMNELQGMWRTTADPVLEIKRVATKYKVSTLVVSRRAKDAGFINQSQFRRFYEEEVVRYQRGQERKDTTESSGNFHNTLSARAGNRFSRAIIANTLEGSTTYKDAFRLLGISNTVAFQNFARAKYGYDFG